MVTEIKQRKTKQSEKAQPK